MSTALVCVLASKPRYKIVLWLPSGCQVPHMLYLLQLVHAVANLLHFSYSSLNEW